jgi:hypothetical protein
MHTIAGQNSPRVVAPIEEEEEPMHTIYTRTLQKALKFTLKIKQQQKLKRDRNT